MRAGDQKQGCKLEWPNLKALLKESLHEIFRETPSLLQTGWQKTTFYTKRTLYYKGLFYVQRPLILRVHLMYQGSFLCTIHFYRTLYYKGPSYVLYIRWTLIKNYILYTKGPSYVNSLEANQPGTNQATPMYIRWTLTTYSILRVHLIYVLYIRWTLIKN